MPCGEAAGAVWSWLCPHRAAPASPQAAAPCRHQGTRTQSSGFPFTTSKKLPEVRVPNQVKYEVA